MAYVIATNVTSPLGFTTEANYLAVKSGRSALRRYDRQWGLPEPFCASLFTDGQQRALSVDGLTRFESLVVRSVGAALEQCPELDVASGRVVFVLSTTKANVEHLGQSPAPSPSVSPGGAARRIARHLGFTSCPVVVCNACISGVAAIILARRLLDSRLYDYAVVCGADVQCPFTVAGFQSLKAVSASACRPFDMERNGLNLGEAASTVVMASGREPWMNILGTVRCGAIRNDAFHVSSPSKNGEGARLALEALRLPVGSVASGAAASSDVLAFINAHGTATMFNDQMESVAIERAGLAGVPVNGLKGYYGHTLGAAGVLETVVSLAALRDRTVLGTRGFEEIGVSGKIAVASGAVPAVGDAFVKMISGFGGGNAAVVVSGSAGAPGASGSAGPTAFTSHRVSISPGRASVDGRQLDFSHDDNASFLTALYKRYVGDYPKFYKMDGLSRLGFMAAELLVMAEAKSSSALASQQRRCQRAVVLFNGSSSVDADRRFLSTLAPDNFFPSPSLFVCTLPNIVTGEIAMRHGYHGETSLFILPGRDESLMRQIALSTFLDSDVTSVVTGWIDYYDESHYSADVMLLTV